MNIYTPGEYLLCFFYNFEIQNINGEISHFRNLVAALAFLICSEEMAEWESRQHNAGENNMMLRLYIHPSKFYFSSVCPFKWQIVTYLQDVHSHKTEFFPYHPVCAAVEFNHAGFLEIMQDIQKSSCILSILKQFFLNHAGPTKNFGQKSTTFYLCFHSMQKPSKCVKTKRKL